MGMKFIAVVWLVGLVLWSIPFADAQQGKVYGVGVLVPPGKAEESPCIRGLRDGLNAGYIEGKNLQLNIPNVKTYDELRPIANRYVEKRMNVVVTDGGTATGIAKEATKEIPIIFIWGLPDPVGAGVVKSLARPETNIYRSDLQPRS